MRHRSTRRRRAPYLLTTQAPERRARSLMERAGSAGRGPLQPGADPLPDRHAWRLRQLASHSARLPARSWRQSVPPQALGKPGALRSSVFRAEKSVCLFPDRQLGAMLLDPSGARTIPKVAATRRGEISSSWLLTVTKSDVEWSAHPGRNVPGCDWGNPVAAERSLTVCAGELCGRLAMEGYDLSKQCKRPTKESQ